MARKRSSSSSRLSTVLEMVHSTVMNTSGIKYVYIHWTICPPYIFGFLHCLFLWIPLPIHFPLLNSNSIVSLLFRDRENKNVSLPLFSNFFAVFGGACWLWIHELEHSHSHSHIVYTVNSVLEIDYHRCRQNFIGVIKLGFIFNLSNMFQCKSSTSPHY